MDAAKFQELALRTERPIDSDVVERFEDVAGRAMFLFRQVSEIAQEADRLKKFIYYGKGGYSSDLDEEPGAILRAEEDLRMVHGILGLVSEIGEVIDCHQSYWDGHVEAIDCVGVLEELGDIGWYCGQLASAAGSDLGVSYEAVIDKLSERYPDCFSEQRALERNIEAERRRLESKIDGEGSF